jgi:hypothetical protein
MAGNPALDILSIEIVKHGNVFYQG